MTDLRRVWRREGEAAPEATVLMPVRNTADIVGEAVASVLGQRGCALEVLISDDSSTDRTLRAALEAAQACGGPHRVEVLRSERRLGIDHLQALVDRASCRLLIQAHGDDESLPGRMARLVALHRETGASLVTSLLERRYGRGRAVEPEPEPAGVSPGWLGPGALLAERGPGALAGARYAMDRDVYDAFPRLTSSRLAFGHDILQPLRALALRGVWYTPERLLRYRIHAGQWSEKAGDRRFAEASAFAAAMRRLAVFRTFREDLGHATAAGRLDAARAASLSAAVGEAQELLAAALVANWQELRRSGREILWATERELHLANQGRLAPLLARRAARTAWLLLPAQRAKAVARRCWPQAFGGA